MNIEIYQRDRDNRPPIIAKLVTLLSVTVAMFFVPACATQSPVAGPSNVQSALLQAGFKSKPATTAQQHQRLRSLTEHKFTLVNQNGETFYVWADKPNHRLYCGSEQAYRNYKEIRKAQYDRESGAFTWIPEPTNVPITVFYGWAPFREW